MGVGKVPAPIFFNSYQKIECDKNKLWLLEISSTNISLTF